MGRRSVALDLDQLRIDRATMSLDEVAAKHGVSAATVCGRLLAANPSSPTPPPPEERSDVRFLQRTKERLEARREEIDSQIRALDLVIKILIQPDCYLK